MFSLVIFPMGSCPECSRGGPNGPPLGPHGPVPCGPPWALMGRALMRPLPGTPGPPQGSYAPWRTGVSTTPDIGLYIKYI